MATNISNLKDQSDKPQNFPALLKQSVNEIARALPAHLSADRMARIALTTFRRTPKLANCDPRSVLACVIQAAQLGLEPDTLGRSYIIPYGNEASFIPGWKGLVDLMNRSGQGTVWTGAVFKGDEFDWQLGDSPHVKHKPRGEAEPAMMTHVYAIGRVKGAEWPVIEVWTAERVAKHRDRYNKVGKRHYSFENWEMYARKVVLLQVMKYMPCSAELVHAMALSDASDAGKQNLTVQDAIEGTWEPVPEEPQQQGADELPQEQETEQAPEGPTAKQIIGNIQACKDTDQLDEIVAMANDLDFKKSELASINKAYSDRREVLEAGAEEEQQQRGARQGIE